MWFPCAGSGDGGHSPNARDSQRAGGYRTARHQDGMHRKGNLISLPVTCTLYTQQITKLSVIHTIEKGKPTVCTYACMLSMNQVWSCSHKQGAPYSSVSPKCLHGTRESRGKRDPHMTTLATTN